MILKTMRPGDAGTNKYVKRFGKNLLAVRYHGDVKKNMRVTTVEIVVDHGFWMPYQRDLYKCLDVDIPLIH